MPEQSATMYPEQEIILIISGTRLKGAPLTHSERGSGQLGARVRSSDAPASQYVLAPRKVPV